MNAKPDVDNTVVLTILEQLGAEKFLMMTGARNLMRTRDGYALRFRLPRGLAKDGIVIVEVHLTPSDLYDVHVYQDSGRELPGSDGLYHDQLAEAFRRLTGLETRMPRIIRRVRA